MKKKIAILGSTGSIGTQALDVIDAHPDKFEVEVITANNNVDLLVEQAFRYLPNVVVIANENKYKIVKDRLASLPVKVYAGFEAVGSVVEMETIDMVLSAMVGFSGLIPTVNAVKNNKQIALANKETLVIAGELVTRLSEENNVPIYPVDSEHSAIFQCLAGEDPNAIEKIILTASGGPFRGIDKESMNKVTREQALNHPNWCMGAKITIDSATLMNKGLEVIEAKWLFGLKRKEIDVIIHPESIIHSMIQFRDGSIKAQMGLPDMKLPIQYAMGFPERLASNYTRFDFTKYPALHFEAPDIETFRCLAIAYEVMEKGGNYPCAMNAANEIAVDAFLCELIGFNSIAEIIEKTLGKISYLARPDLEDYIQTDEEARNIARDFINKI
ncbi:MAG: 1-deoxy-D-xylulose-5-phosphate reductoisomerase [Bacteroidota bacterium]